MKKLFAVLQKIGKSLMLPVSVLPAAGLLLRFGQPDLLNMPYMETAGNVIFQNLPMIFAVGVAIGFSNGEGVAALAAVIGEFILEGIIKVAGTNSGTSINMGVFGGIIIGLMAGYLYNRFHNIRLPQVLGFFGGKRFVPIITSLAALIFAIIGVKLWMPVQNGINMLAQAASSSILGPAFYAAGKRLLIPVGLHHMYYPPFLYQFGKFVSGGVTYFGDSPRYFHGDPKAGIFMASEFPILMFGLPGAAIAMIAAAKKKNRKRVSGIMISAALTAFLTGITEPIEYSFIFVAPVLFVFHVLAAFSAGIVTSLLHIRLGYTFSASLIDYLLGFKYAGHPWLIWPVGIAYFAIYFAVFYFGIKMFNLKTPGRDDEEDDDDSVSMPLNIAVSEKAERVLKAIGGKDNIEILDACITRLRLTLKNTGIIDKKALKSLGAAGVMIAGSNAQIVFGTEAERIKEEIKAIISGIRTEKTIKDEKVSLPEEVKEAASSEFILASPVDGEIVDISRVPDAVFAEKTLGDGFAVLPSGNKVYAPADGDITVLFPTKHAFAITAEGGLEILVHVGIDTVALNGEGFTAHVNQGDKVKKGDLILTLDTELIEKMGKSIITPVIITNMNIVKDINIEFGNKYHGDKTAVVTTK